MTRMVRNCLILVVFLTGVVCVVFGQERTLGSWRMYMPYGASLGICDAGDRIYCAGTQSIFSFEKGTNTIQTYDKSSGLSDVNVKTIAYDPASSALVIAYNNSNLDLMFNGTDVYNITDIKVKSV